MHSISLDGYCMSCTCVQTFIKKNNNKKLVRPHVAIVVQSGTPTGKKKDVEAEQKLQHLREQHNRFA